eukprot:COSAG02_NODE_4731_length_5043_cov_3.579895_1_plen_87_part_10
MTSVASVTAMVLQHAYYNVHLLRGLPLRLVQEVADLHDQAIKVACAASLGMVDAELVHMARLPPPGRRSTLILLTPDGDGVWYGPGA